MNSRRLRAAATSVVAAGLLLFMFTPSAPADDSATPATTSKNVCNAAPVRYARCLSKVVTDANGNPKATPTLVGGFSPADLRSAYNLPSTGGAGQTIAIVDAYDNPRAESDLAIYRQQFGLGTCSTQNLCFRKIDQRGGTTYPVGDTGWGGEIALDIDMASAVCPACHILLVEADSNNDTDLAAAVNEAVALGANVVSNSYGGGEYPEETLLNSSYSHPGHVIVASSGDEGYVSEFPAAAPGVVAVGGTTLRRGTSGSSSAASGPATTSAGGASPAFEKGGTTTTAPGGPTTTINTGTTAPPPPTKGGTTTTQPTTTTTRPPTTTSTSTTTSTTTPTSSTTSTTVPGSPRNWTETVWSGAGSGCSAYEPKPSWQHDTGCGSHRTIADVAAVADPSSGVAVYDTYGYSGWLIFGGTSVSAPVVAGVFALNGHTSTDGPASLYAPGASLFDVVTGSNASSTSSKTGPPTAGCSPAYLCTGGPGYDGPTGNGTPNGVTAF